VAAVPDSSREGGLTVDERRDLFRINETPPPHHGALIEALDLTTRCLDQLFNDAIQNEGSFPEWVGYPVRLEYQEIQCGSREDSLNASESLPRDGYR